MLGADYILATDDAHEIALSILSQGTETLLALHKQASTPDWCWFEARLAYDNARLPEAMIRAGNRLGRAEVTDCGIQTLRWINALQTAPAGHFRPVGSNSFGRDHETPRPFDQQPVEVWAAIDACSAAYDATGDAIWLAHAQRAFDWFGGANDRGVVVGNAVTGTCHDGINPRGLNLNEGAESVLAFQLSACALDAFEKKII